jgi:hypothetical protein
MFNEVEHSGIDLFLDNISSKDADKFCRTLNALGRTMNGHKLNWQLTYRKRRATITAMYPDTKVTQIFIPRMLQQNRDWVETGLESLGMKKELYTGSEFYLRVPDIDVFKKTYDDYFALARKASA